MEAAPFGKWRSFFWPIYRSELKKFLPLFLIFFLISFNYNALRSYKDTIVITASNSGAETIPFIKLWAVLPCALAFTFLFTRLSNKFSREKVFYIIMSIFLTFFFVFTFILYPARDFLHPNFTADRLQELLPAGFKGLIAIYRNWTFTLFYVMSELWSTTVFSVLFWGFANAVVNVKEAKRFYGLLTSGGSLAGIFAGYGAIRFSDHAFISWIPYGKTSWDQSIFFLTCTLLTFGLITIFLFRWLNKHVVLPAESLSKEPATKVRMSMRENFATLARSKYLICIAFIVLAYNVAINLVEVAWKDQMKALYTNPADYNAYMGQVMIIMAIVASIAGILITSNVIQRFSWTTSALIPTAIVAITGLAFFYFLYFPSHLTYWIAGLLQVSPLFLCVTLGSIQNCLSRASKYTIFDSTKEIAFIPLSDEAKLKGKAAIDGVGSRLGKSGGSVIYQGLILVVSSVSASIPYVALIFMGIILIWALSVITLGKQFDELAGAKRKPILEN